MSVLRFRDLLIIEYLKSAIKKLDDLTQKVTKEINLATRQFAVKGRNKAERRKAEHWSNSFG